MGLAISFDSASMSRAREHSEAKQTVHVGWNTDKNFRKQDDPTLK